MDKEIEDRIFAAADTLYEESGRESFPKVDSVRKVVRANMNDVCEAMRKWRDLQRVQPTAPVVIHVPQAIEDASRALLGSLWQSAQELSNNALRSAQSGWEVEKLAAAIMQKELADGFEVKAREAQTAQDEITLLQSSAAASASDLDALRGELAATKTELGDALAMTGDLQAKVTQADTDAGVLNNELANAQDLIQTQVLELAQVRERLDAQEKQIRQAGMEHAAELDRLNAILQDERKSHVDAVAQQRDELREQAKNATAARDVLNKEITTLKAEAAAAKQAQSQHEASTQQRVDQAETRLGEANEATSAAREEAAELRGQVEALQKQMANMLLFIARWKTSGEEEKSLNVGQVQAAAAGDVDFSSASAVPELGVVAEIRS